MSARSKTAGSSCVARRKRMRAYEQQRDIRALESAAGDAAQDEASHTAPAMRSHGDQIDLFLGCDLNDRRWDRSTKGRAAVDRYRIGLPAPSDFLQILLSQSQLLIG